MLPILRIGVPEDAIKGPQVTYDILPPSKDYSHAGFAVPTKFEHAGVDVWVCFDDGVGAGVVFLYFVIDDACVVLGGYCGMGGMRIVGWEKHRVDTHTQRMMWKHIQGMMWTQKTRYGGGSCMVCTNRPVHGTLCMVGIQAGTQHQSAFTTHTKAKAHIQHISTRFAHKLCMSDHQWTLPPHHDSLTLGVC